MSLNFDEFKVPLTVSAPNLINSLDNAVFELISWSGNPGTIINSALAQDSEFLMGNIFRGVLILQAQAPIRVAAKYVEKN